MLLSILVHKYYPDSPNNSWEMSLRSIPFIKSFLYINCFFILLQHLWRNRRYLPYFFCMKIVWNTIFVLSIFTFRIRFIFILGWFLMRELIKRYTVIYVLHKKKVVHFVLFSVNVHWCWLNTLMVLLSFDFC